MDVPAGSFRWDKLVRSSEASRTGGFIKGGRFLSSAFPSRAETVVVVVIFYKQINDEIVEKSTSQDKRVIHHTSPTRSPEVISKTRVAFSPSTFFEITFDETHPS